MSEEIRAGRLVDALLVVRLVERFHLGVTWVEVQRELECSRRTAYRWIEALARTGEYEVTKKGHYDATRVRRIRAA